MCSASNKALSGGMYRGRAAPSGGGSKTRETSGVLHLRSALLSGGSGREVEQETFQVAKEDVEAERLEPIKGRFKNRSKHVRTAAGGGCSASRIFSCSL